MQEIKATPISFAASSVDCIIWHSSSSGNFDLKKAYKLACLADEGWSSVSFNGEWIWKVSTIPKIQCFIWQCFLQSIQVRGVLSTRGLNILDVCPLCNEGIETITHALGIAKKPKFFGTLQPSPLCLLLSFTGLAWRIGFGSIVVALGSPLYLILAGELFFSFGI